MVLLFSVKIWESWIHLSQESWTTFCSMNSGRRWRAQLKIEQLPNPETGLWFFTCLQQQHLLWENCCSTAWLTSGFVSGTEFKPLKHYTATYFSFLCWVKKPLSTARVAHSHSGNRRVVWSQQWLAFTSVTDRSIWNIFGTYIGLWQRLRLTEENSDSTV